MQKIKAVSAGGKSATLKIVFTALFVSLAVVANAYFKINISPTLKFSFNLTVYFLAGVFLGGPLGFAVGAIGDLIGFLMSPDGSFNPLITLSEGMFCFIPGIIFQIKNKIGGHKNRRLDNVIDIGLIVLSFALCFVICTVLLTSAGLWLYISSFQTKYGTFGALAAYRAVGQLPNSAVNLALAIMLFVALKRAGLFARSKKKLEDNGLN